MNPALKAGGVHDVFGHLVATGCCIITQTVHPALQITLLIGRRHSCIPGNTSGPEVFHLFTTHHDHATQKVSHPTSGSTYRGVLTASENGCAASGTDKRLRFGLCVK